VKPSPPRYDFVVKDLFKQDGPTLLSELTGGIRVTKFLDPQFGVIERHADLVLQLEDRSILHIEFQSVNDRRMAYRMAVYAPLIAGMYLCRVRQVVLYFGERRMRMADRVELGDYPASYRLLDVRQLDTGKLLQSGSPADYVLAMLSREGPEKLGAILEMANQLQGAARDRVLAQMGALSGLRRLSKRFKMECNAMGIAIDIKKNEFLNDIWTSGVEKGRAEGREEGRAEGRAGMLRLVGELLETKFGPLPKWARERLAKSTPARLDRFAKKILTAETLEGVLGRR